MLKSSTMAIVKPFKGLRPPKELVKDIASRPYDVLNTAEARIEANGNEKSLLHIIKPEIDLPEDTDVHSDPVYSKAVQNFKKFKTYGWLQKDKEPKFYIYSQTMNGKTQYGIVGCAAISDYEKKVIREHELTRPDKEEDRMRHVYDTNANMEPVFFAYPAVTEIDDLVDRIVNTKEPEYDFVAADGVKHTLWLVLSLEDNITIEKLFKEKVPYTYVADGHHRTAAAAKVGARKKSENPKHTGKEPYNYFMAVHFPDNQLTIIDYNRVVKDLNGMTVKKFISRLEENFEVECKGAQMYRPNRLHNFGMYVDGNWYSLTAKPGTFNNNDPIDVLDVTISSNLILKDLLGIEDLRRSKRVDFVGGIRGLGELKSKVDSGEMKIAFALYPVSMKQLMDIADSGNIMPPKTTWFEPKLRSGMVIHELS